MTSTRVPSQVFWRVTLPAAHAGHRGRGAAVLRAQLRRLHHHQLRLRQRRDLPEVRLRRGLPGHPRPGECHRLRRVLPRDRDRPHRAAVGERPASSDSPRRADRVRRPRAPRRAVGRASCSSSANCIPDRASSGSRRAPTCPTACRCCGWRNGRATGPSTSIDASGAHFRCADGIDHVDLCLGDTGAMVRARARRIRRRHHGATRPGLDLHAAHRRRRRRRRPARRTLRPARVAVHPLGDRRQPPRAALRPPGHRPAQGARHRLLLPRHRRRGLRDPRRRRPGRVAARQHRPARTPRRDHCRRRLRRRRRRSTPRSTPARSRRCSIEPAHDQHRHRAAAARLARRRPRRLRPHRHHPRHRRDPHPLRRSRRHDRARRPSARRRRRRQDHRRRHPRGRLGHDAASSPSGCATASTGTARAGRTSTSEESAAPSPATRSRWPASGPRSPRC